MSEFAVKLKAAIDVKAAPELTTAVKSKMVVEATT